MEYKNISVKQTHGAGGGLVSEVDCSKKYYG